MLLIDILVGTLLLFPLIAENIAIELSDSFSLELTDLGLPLLLACLITLAVRRLSRERWNLDFVVRAGRRASLGMRDAFQQSPRRALAHAGVALGVLAVLALIWRYWDSQSPGFGIGAAFWYLTHGAGAVIVVAMLAGAIQRWTGEPWDNSFFLRPLLRLGRAWLAAVGHSPARVLWGTTAAVGTAWFLVSLLRHWAFESHGFDLGIFTNVLWNLAHGNGYVSSMKGGINLFIDHQSPLLWVLAPLFWLIPRPETLLFAQAFGLAAGGPALFYLGRAHIGREHWAPAALPWLYWLYLPVRNANAFDFHPEVFMLPLFLWAFAAFASDRRWTKGFGLLALIGALGAKESAAIVAVGIGVGWALLGGGPGWRSRWPGVVLAAAGVALFIFDVKVVPRLLDTEYAYMNLFERFGGGVQDVLLAPFTQPVFFFSQLIDAARLNFLFWTLAPLGFLPLFNWRAALAAVPPYLVLFLTEGDQRVRLVFHYGIEPGSALFWALPFGLAAFARRFGWKNAGIWMLFWALAGHGQTEITRARSFDRFLHANWLASEAMPCINPEAATAASDSLVPHLATRPWISYLDQLEQKPSGDAVRCVVTDLSVDNWPVGRNETRRILGGLPDQGYRQAWKCNDFAVYEFGNSACLRCVPKCY